MPRRKNTGGERMNVSEERIEDVIRLSLSVLPLLKRKVLSIDSIQAEHNIPLSHVQVLFMLRENSAMSISEISRRLSIAKPNITPLVDRLISQGLVDRRRDETDRRVVNVVITEEGIEKARRIQQTATRQGFSWISSMTDKELGELSASLNSIVKLLADAPD